MKANRRGGVPAKVVASSAVALALFGAGAWWLRGEERRALAPESAPVAPSSEALAPSEPTVEGSPGARSTSEAPAPDAADATPQESETVVSVEETLVRITGAAVRVEASGIEHAGDDGKLVLHWLGASGPERRELEVVAGAFGLEAPRDALLRVSELALAGRPLALEAREIVVPASRFVEVRGLELFDVLLHVVDAASGEELDGVEVWRAKGPAGEHAWQHPGAAPEGEPLLAGARSPVRVPPRADWYGSTIAYWVRAKDHAWARVALEHGSGGERTLRLDGAGALEVSLVGSAPWLEPLVRLWPPDAATWDAYAYAERRPDADDVALFEALAPGRYVASVERGWADRRVSFGKAEVDVEAGATARVRIPVELPDELRAVTIAGTLSLGAGWDARDARLVLTAQADASVWSEEPIELAWDAMRPIEGGSERARAFELELPTAGGYELAVEPRLLRRFLDVPEGGLSDLELAVPDAARVEVAVVDDASGEAIAVESLYWSPPRVEGIVATPLYTATAASDDGRVTFVTPAGVVQIAPRDFSLCATLDVEHPGENPSFEVRPGRNELELRVRRQLGVRFRFLDGDAEVPWSWGWRLRAERTDGKERDVARSIGILWFREPGAYELFSEGIPGYASIDHTPLDVRAGEGVQEFELRLVREPPR